MEESVEDVEKIYSSGEKIVDRAADTMGLTGKGRLGETKGWKAIQLDRGLLRVAMGGLGSGASDIEITGEIVYNHY